VLFTFPDDLSASPQTLSGWGRTRPVTAQVVQPTSVEQLQKLIRQAPPGALIARGLGRSYGDAAQLSDAAVLELNALSAIHLDPASGTVTCGAGVSLDHLLRLLVPAGFFLPVTPGTRNVTIGGAIAADVHGKNHHVDGSFGTHVQSLRLVDGNGELRLLTPSGRGSVDEAEQFWTTVGGMGLTGVIVEATFKLIPISSSLISVNTSRHKDLDALMQAMVAADSRYRYSVAWIDSLDPNGRGVLTCGDHAPAEQLPKAQQSTPLDYDPKALASAPPFLPGGLLNKLTVRAFNEAWYRKAPRQRAGELQAMAPFFHPLDGVQDWNRIYGPAGFLQYQFAVPDAAAHLVTSTLEALRQVGAPSFLTVLKRFGLSNPAPLSFPLPGWTLAADLPAAVPGLLEVLDQLDQEVAAVGGRLYLAKDSRQSASMLQRSYPRLQEWQQSQRMLDPRGVFSSDLAIRTGLLGGSAE
jgi:decaprenylphospho-beta-D-ribofuranose 2-oxidase